MKPSSQPFALLIIACSGYLDAYTFSCRGGVFANAQTGNVILGALNLSSHEWHDALQHLWPLLAFAAGVTCAALLRRSADERLAAAAAPATLGLSVLVLTAAAAVPLSAPATVVIIPITLVASMQFELFRSAGELAYAPIATSGNLMRMIESGHAQLRGHDDDSRRAFVFYVGLFLTFTVGAVCGAVASHHLGARATLIPAAALAAGLALVVTELRRTGGAATADS